MATLRARTRSRLLVLFLLNGAPFIPPLSRSPAGGGRRARGRRPAGARAPGVAGVGRGRVSVGAVAEGGALARAHQGVACVLVEERRGFFHPPCRGRAGGGVAATRRGE